MLKPADPGPPPPERPVGELVRELIEEGRAYAQAEIDLAKAIFDAKARALILPAILFGIAFILALAGVTALSIGVVISLALFMGPLAAGIVGLVVFAAVSTGLAWFAAKRVKRIL